MQVKDIMTKPVIRIRPEEPVSVAARTLERYNIGALPVCGGDGRLCGMVTDRDLAIRCLAAERPGELTRVRDVMTSQVVWVEPNMELSRAAQIMGQRQIRRLPVTEGGKLCGMVSLADLALRQETGPDAGEALTEISSSLSSR